MSQQQSTLSLKRLSLRIDGKALIDNLSFAVKGGEILTLMGPSGSGKSSILNFICGNLPRDFYATGEVWLNQQDITQLATEKRRVGILFQDDLLFPHLSVAANLAFGVPARIRGQARKIRIAKALAASGLAGYGKRDPATLSGGQRARIAVMRTLLAEPQAILLDEPFNKLDSALRSKFRHFVFSHIRKARLPCVLVTHDGDDAQSTNGRIMQLSNIT